MKNYTLLEEKYCSDIEGTGKRYIHDKSGAEIITLDCDDPNKTMAIAFRTPCFNSKGIPHILEHSVLEGSEKYPLKDPFVQLMKGSLNTYLNAMTFDQFTIYPVSSCNDKDFRTLMDVYCDAVYFPLVAHKKEIFEQEGWHYEEENGELFFNGVVYNEMKGETASQSFVLANAVNSALFPDTEKNYVSGGMPFDIVDLTYEELQQFRLQHYHPANSVIVLYGKMNYEETLTYLDEDYLSRFDSAQKMYYQSQKDFTEMVESEKKYPITDVKDKDKGATFSLSWRIKGHDVSMLTALSALDFALVDASSGRIRQALLKEGIGEEISSSLDTSSSDPVYSILVRKAYPNQKDRFKEIVYSVLNDTALNGPDMELVRSFLHSSEYDMREDDYGRTPKGLVCGLRLLEKSLFNEDDVFSPLNTKATFAEDCQKIEDGLLKTITVESLLNNPNCAFVCLYPSLEVLAEDENKILQKQEERLSAFTAEEKEELMREAQALKHYRESEDDLETLTCIPLLEREDLNKEESNYPNQYLSLNDISVLVHPLHTNDLSYMAMRFDMSALNENELSAAAFLAKALGDIDTVHYSYSELGQKIGATTGGIDTSLEVVDNRQTETLIRQFIVTARYLDKEKENAFELMKELLLNSCFNDVQRFKELLEEAKAQEESEGVYRGNRIASREAATSFSLKEVVKDTLGGRRYYAYLKESLSQINQDPQGYLMTLKTLLGRIVSKENLMVVYTGTDYDDSKEILADFINELPVKEKEKDADLSLNPNRKALGLSTATAVQYCALVGKGPALNNRDYAHLLVLNQILNTDYLWQNVRVLGGAYGAGASFARDGLAMFTSYRDPQMDQTIEVFNKIPEMVADFDCDEREMRQYIIGTMNIFDSPLSPAKTGQLYTSRSLSGLTQDDLREIRQTVINTQPEDIRALADLVRGMIACSRVCIVGEERKLKQSASLEEVEVLLKDRI